MDLPRFKYHPDPLATGSVVASEATCPVCETARGFVYDGSIFGEADVENICPWCIADGSAHEQCDVEFTDIADVGGYGDWDDVPEHVAEEVAYRTPGFSGWQQERWYTHCGDACEFLGPMGKQQLENLGPQAVSAIRDESGFTDEDWTEFFESLDRDRGPTAYLFRCLHCGHFGGYTDFP